LIGVIFLLLFPRVLQDPLRYLQARPLTCMGVSVFTLMQLGWGATAIFLSGLFLAGEASVKLDRWKR